MFKTALFTRTRKRKNAYAHPKKKSISKGSRIQLPFNLNNALLKSDQQKAMIKPNPIVPRKLWNC